MPLKCTASKKRHWSHFKSRNVLWELSNKQGWGWKGPEFSFKVDTAAVLHTSLFHLAKITHKYTCWKETSHMRLLSKSIIWGCLSQSRSRTMSSRGRAVCSLSIVLTLSLIAGRSLRNRYSRFLQQHKEQNRKLQNPLTKQAPRPTFCRQPAWVCAARWCLYRSRSHTTPPPSCTNSPAGFRWCSASPGTCPRCRYTCWTWSLPNASTRLGGKKTTQGWQSIFSAVEVLIPECSRQPSARVLQIKHPSHLRHLWVFSLGKVHFHL